MKQSQFIDSEKLQSEVIAFLRFPLIVGVVLIHTRITSINGISGNLINPLPFNGAFPLYEFTIYLCAQIIARVAVPLFFILSGFLFFYKSNELTANIYIEKLKKRGKSLLIPYIIWNILAICFFYIGGKLFPDNIKLNIGEGYKISDWLMTLWNFNNTGNPISLQFWFIRDLMVMVLFTPLIFCLTKKLKYILPLLLGGLWLTGWWFNWVGFSIDAMFFFSLGAYFSIRRKNFVELVKDHSTILGLFYLIIVIIAFICKHYDWAVFIRRASILFGILFFVALSSTFLEKRKWKVNTFLTESSFFIYAYHVIALIIFKRPLLCIIPCTTDISATIFYFTWALITILVGLILYYYLKKLFPKTIRIVTGGR